MVPKMKEGRPHENVASPWSKLKGLQLPKGIVVFEFPDGSDNPSKASREAHSHVLMGSCPSSTFLDISLGASVQNLVRGTCHWSFSGADPCYNMP
ncbi:predicted protein [Sclerotinia sclerotiorum 1980 UF-70]|uniref:Uncharacterized protein n=1 Tax=Sclerotinia sclerotiorum (strain ATCC 18683 / 1980 / Ss-1) TaxID=665079 RepID=A7F5X4_SCLS1|nr:predicted protein [Sclerotinia sclerotiorum 1980 UF-70]EDN98145.1 predicted protein [Sclerotinia sclerotiorum 1980 UF-70]